MAQSFIDDKEKMVDFWTLDKDEFLQSYSYLTEEEYDATAAEAHKLADASVDEHNEQLNTALYKKMFAEQEAYKEWLLTRSPQEILDHAYEYNVREDILLSLEENNLSNEQAEALLESDIPLSDVYKLFDKRESSHMEEIWDCVESRANDVIKNQEKQRSQPLYTKDIEYAVKHDEAAQFRDSADANTACVKEIEKSVYKHYDGYVLDTAKAFDDVVGKYGAERVRYVLASTVVSKKNDGRISHTNIAWAQTIPGSDIGRDASSVVHSVHPGLINLMVNKARDVLTKEKERQSSIHEKLNRKTDAPAKKPSLRKEQER